MKNRQCVCCNKKKLKKLFSITSPYLDRKEKYVIYICDYCGHGFADGKKDPKFIKKIYSSNFFSNKQQSIENKNSPIIFNSTLRAKKISSEISGNLLDIGAGNGAFLRAAKIFFCAEGVELSNTACKKARSIGCKVYEGDFLSVQLKNKKYNVVTLWDVLASFDRPDIVLKKCNSLLKKGGKIFMTVPMIDSFAAKLFKSYWPLLIPPVNLNYFSKKGIISLARKNGFSYVSCKYYSKKISFQFLAIKACRSFKLQFLEFIFSKLFPTWNINLNTYDIATVVLEKKKKI